MNYPCKHGVVRYCGICELNMNNEPKFKRGDKVRKVKGSCWSGIVVGEYSTTLTPEGYAVESFTEKGSVQIYPASALEAIPEKKMLEGYKHIIDDGDCTDHGYYIPKPPKI